MAPDQRTAELPEVSQENPHSKGEEGEASGWDKGLWDVGTLC